MEETAGGTLSHRPGAARAAGAPLVLVSFGYTEVPAWELRPDRLIDHFDELVPACLELLAQG